MTDIGLRATTAVPENIPPVIDLDDEAASRRRQDLVARRPSCGGTIWGVAERPQILDDIGVRWWCAVLGCVFAGAEVFPRSQGVGFVEQMALVAG